MNILTEAQKIFEGERSLYKVRIKELEETVQEQILVIKNGVNQVYRLEQQNANLLEVLKDIAECFEGVGTANPYFIEKRVKEVLNSAHKKD